MSNDPKTDLGVKTANDAAAAFLRSNAADIRSGAANAVLHLRQ
jgi:hypothetical protein